MVEKFKEPMALRTVGEIAAAHEWLFNQQKDGRIDPKTADSLNTTLKGTMYLMVKMKMDYAKLYVQSQIKKIEIPTGLLPQ